MCGPRGRCASLPCREDLPTPGASAKDRRGPCRPCLERVQADVLPFTLMSDDRDVSHLPAWVKSPRQTTDGHLAELANANGAIRATLDEKIPATYLILSAASRVTRLPVQHTTRSLPVLRAYRYVFSGGSSKLKSLRDAGPLGELDCGSSHTGDCNSGMGFAWKSLRHCLAMNLAALLAFFRRALSVERPEPAYICR